MSKTFDLIIASLDEILLKQSVKELYLPTSNGEVGILSNHITYLVDTIIGQAHCVTGNNENFDIPLPTSGIFFIKENHARLWLC